VLVLRATVPIIFAKVVYFLLLAATRGRVREWRRSDGPNPPIQRFPTRRLHSKQPPGDCQHSPLLYVVIKTTLVGITDGL
jgi:hypothetical protein